MHIVDGDLRVESSSASPTIQLTDTGVADSYIYMPNGSNALAYNVGGAERMRIDSSGRVTMPYQPSFNVYHGAAGIGQDISFASVKHNRGNCWNTSTNTFTAPVAGTYQFQFAFLHDTFSTSYCRVLFKVNGYSSTQFGDTLQSNPSGSFNASSASVALYLQANDTVKLHNEQSSLYGADFGAFSGYLIG